MEPRMWAQLRQGSPSMLGALWDSPRAACRPVAGAPRRGGRKSAPVHRHHTHLRIAEWHVPVLQGASPPSARRSAGHPSGRGQRSRLCGHTQSRGCDLGSNRATSPAHRGTSRPSHTAECVSASAAQAGRRVPLTGEPQRPAPAKGQRWGLHPAAGLFGENEAFWEQ